MIYNSRLDNLGLYEQISVTNIRSYLLSRGWIIKEHYGEKALLLSNKNESMTLMLPLKESFADYALRLSELIGQVSRYEERETSVILKEVMLSSFDVFRIKLIDNSSDGTLPLNVSPNLIDKAKEMLTSAASSYLQPKRVYGPRKSKEVEQYIDKIRLGQTEVGSYVFTLLSPVVPRINATLPLPFSEPISHDEEPFGREVVKQLNRAIFAVHEAAQRAITTDDLSSFDSAVSKGVNANLCEAISDITHEAGAAIFSINWGAVRPIMFQQDETELLKPQKFNVRLADVIEEAAKKFREIEPRPDTLLKGYIYSLDKDKRDPQGNVLMKASLDGSFKTVKLYLNDEEYETAITAHRGYKTIIVEGDLQQRGKVRILNKIRNFRIESEED